MPTAYYRYTASIILANNDCRLQLPATEDKMPVRSALSVFSGVGESRLPAHHSSLTHSIGDHARGDSWIEKLWNAGQRLLVNGQYCNARRELEAAEATAFHRRNAALLTRIYLPLLETCRQVRQLSTEGLISIHAHRPTHRSVRAEIKRFEWHGGGVLISGSPAHTQMFARRARLKPCPIECLRLVRHGDQIRITNPHQPKFCNGLPLVWRPVEYADTLPAAPEQISVALPPPGDYAPGMVGHSCAAESILLLYEALALRQLHQWKLPSEGWPLIAALRRIRLIDMACEPVTIRLLHEAEKLAAL